MAATTAASQASTSQSTLNHVLPPFASSREIQASSSSASQSTNLVTPHTLALSLPHPPNTDPLIDALPYQLLLAEMPAALRHSSRKASRRRRRLLDGMAEAGLDSGVADISLSGAGATGRGNSTKQQEDAEVEVRLEQIGVHVGANLAERLSRDRPPLPTTLDILKFLCKDFWIAIWDKQVDGLRTNHRGVYVLTDHHFKPLSRISTPSGGGQAVLGPGLPSAIKIAKQQLPHSVGLLRGALSRLGVTATVVAESTPAGPTPGLTKPGDGAPGGSGQSGPTATATASAVAGTTFHVRVTSNAPSGAGGTPSAGSRSSTDR